MKILTGVMLLAADTGRARAYVDLLRRAGLTPAAAVLMRGQLGPVSVAPVATERFDNLTPLKAALERASIPVAVVDTNDLNSAAVCAAVAARPESLVIFAGPAAAIVKAPLFATGKQFLHVHPGRLPDFRGSTPMYYSLLAEQSLTATALFLAPAIDEGPIVAVKDFDPPADRREIDHGFDPWMRASLLVDVLQRYHREGHLPSTPQPVAGTTWYVIHPVLKHLAILAPAGSHV